MRKIARVNGPLGNQSSRFQNVILYIKKTKSKMDALCLLRKRLHPLRLIKKRIFHNKASDSGRSENNAALLIEKANKQTN